MQSLRSSETSSSSKTSKDMEPPPRYTLDRRLSGQGPIFDLCASATGNILACGGEDGIRLFDLKEKFEYRAPRQNAVSLRQISAITWITGPGDTAETLCFGTGLGWLTFWSLNTRLSCFNEMTFRRVAGGSEILCITHDKTPAGTFRVALGFRDGIVQVWNLDRACNLTSVYSVHLAETIPKAMTFTGASNASLDPRQLCVLGFVDGRMIRLHETTGQVLSEKEITMRVGNAAFSEELDLCIIDNVDNGFDIHNLETGALVRTLKCTPNRRCFPRQVALGEGGAVVICGSNDGNVCVFERDSGVLVHTIRHSSIGRCQSVTAFTRDGEHFIATASSDDSDGVSVQIWRKYMSPIVEKERERLLSPTTSRYSRLHWVAILVLLLSSLVALGSKFYLPAGSIKKINVHPGRSNMPVREVHYNQGIAPGRETRRREYHLSDRRSQPYERQIPANYRQKSLKKASSESIASHDPNDELAYREHVPRHRSEDVYYEPPVDHYTLHADDEVHHQNVFHGRRSGEPLVHHDHLRPLRRRRPSQEEDIPVSSTRSHQPSNNEHPKASISDEEIIKKLKLLLDKVDEVPPSLLRSYLESTDDAPAHMTSSAVAHDEAAATLPDISLTDKTDLQSDTAAGVEERDSLTVENGIERDMDGAGMKRGQPETAPSKSA